MYANLPSPAHADKPNLRDIFLKSMRPIILIPNSHKAGNVSKRNIRSLLQDQSYFSPEDVERADKVLPVRIRRRILDVPLEFQFLDIVPAIRQSQSSSQLSMQQRENQQREYDSFNDNLVGCFLSGSNFQIKGLRDGEKEDVFFTRVRGFYLTYSDVPVPEYIQKCKVLVLKLDRRDRSRDKDVENTFWHEIQKQIEYIVQLKAQNSQQQLKPSQQQR